MRQKLQIYLNTVEEYLRRPKLKEIDQTLTRHRQQIHFFAMERLFHLIVTMFVGMFALLSFLGFIITENIGLFFLCVLFLSLFLPYLYHYYHLENGVQKMYEQYWQLEQIASREKEKHTK